MMPLGTTNMLRVVYLATLGHTHIVYEFSEVSGLIQALTVEKNVILLNFAHKKVVIFGTLCPPGAHR